MENQRRAALVYAGQVSRGGLTHLPELRKELAFIKSSSIPTASRAVRALRSGRAVQTLEEFKQADLILISVPEAQINAAVAELEASALSWSGRTVVLFDSDLDSAALTPLALRGASIASLNWCPHPQRFFAEGQPEAIRRIKKLMPARSLMVIRSKSDYMNGVRASTEEFYPLLSAAVEGFQKSGMHRAAALKTAALLFAESARVFLRAGKRVLKQPKRKASLPES